MEQGQRCWIFDGMVDYKSTLCRTKLIMQGGPVAAAFASSFPHLIDESVIFISSSGLLEVCLTLPMLVMSPLCLSTLPTAETNR